MAAVLAVVASMAVIAAAYQGQKDPDLVAEWLVAAAARDGLDPFSPVAELAESYPVEFDRPLTVPRTPGALLLFQPLAAAPGDWLPILAMVGVVVPLVIAGLLIDRRAVFWMPVFLLSMVGWDIARHGHISMALLAVGAVLVVKYPERDSTGIALGAVIALKLYPAFWAVALWLAGKRRTAVVAFVTFVLINLIGLALPGLTLGSALSGLAMAPSILGGFRNGSLIDYGVPVWFAVAIALAFLAFWRRDKIVEASLPMSLLVAPVAWIFYLVTILPGVGRKAASWFVVGWVVYRIAWESVDVHPELVALIVPASALAALILLWRGRTRPT